MAYPLVEGEVRSHLAMDASQMYGRALCRLIPYNSAVARS